jgi:RNA polymerase sigma-70 factor (ECF subfamily)
VAATSDETLVLGFLDGDRSASLQVDAWLRQVLGHPALGLGAEAEDVAQDVRRKLVVSWRAGRFQGSSSLRTYVWRAAQHAAIDHIRARRARPADVALDEAAEPAASTLDPQAAVLQDERRRLFERVLALLAEECRDLLQLIAFDELGYAEIARRLGTTEGAVKVRALRCRQRAVHAYGSVTAGRSGRQFNQRL